MAICFMKYHTMPSNSTVSCDCGHTDFEYKMKFYFMTNYFYIPFYLLH